MKKLFYEDVLEKEKQLLQSASIKEKCLFHFLAKSPQTKLDIENFGEIDKICIVGYSGSKKDKVLPKIERLRGSKPQHGVHFTNNLVTIIGFALCSDEVKNNELKDYFKNTSFKEQYIISSIFDGFSLDKFEPKSTLEKLLSEVLIAKNYHNKAQDVFSALSQCNELIDLYLLKIIVVEINKMHPNLSSEKSLDEILSEIDRQVNKGEKWASGFIIGILVLVSIAVSILVYKKWDGWQLEPIITGVLFFVPIVAGAIIHYFKIGVEWRRKVMEKAKWKVFKFLLPELYSINSVAKKIKEKQLK